MLILIATLTCAASARGQIFTWTDSGDKLGDSDFASMIWAKSFGVADMVRVANKLKARPPGLRCLFLWCDNDAIYGDPQDQLTPQFKSLWWPHAMATSLAHNSSLASQLKAADVKPDIVVLDDESGPGVYTMTLDNINAIAADPRGAAMGVVPLAQGDEAAALRFNDIALNATNAALWKAVFEPFHKIAPDAALSQGGSIITPEEGKVVHEYNDHAAYATTIAGTVASPGVYGGSGLNPLTKTPYTNALFLSNWLRVAARHNTVWPWYAHEGADPKWVGTGYWEEMIRHAFLCCGLRGLFFDPDQPTAVAKFAVIYNDTKKTVGGRLPTTLCSSETIASDAQFFVTARADGWTDASSTPTRIVGRVTFGPGVTTATFKVANQTFTITPAPGQPGAWFTYGSIGATTQPSAETPFQPAVLPKPINSSPSSRRHNPLQPPSER